MYNKHNWTNDNPPYINGKNLQEIEDGIVGAYKHLIGFISYYCKETPPDGWLVCDGREIDREIYADLYAVVGDIFGAGNGSTTFNLPDLRGEFIRGYSDGSMVDAGRTFGSKQEGTRFRTSGYAAVISTETSEIEVDDVVGSMGGSASSAGTSDIVSIRPRNIALLPCIFAGVRSVNKEG